MAASELVLCSPGVVGVYGWTYDFVGVDAVVGGESELRRPSAGAPETD